MIFIQYKCQIYAVGIFYNAVIRSILILAYEQICYRVSRYIHSMLDALLPLRFQYAAVSRGILVIA